MTLIETLGEVAPELSKYADSDRKPWSGEQVIYSFPNSFGASVICGPHSYGGKDGLLEIAVFDENGEITYDTPVTSDVMGYLSPSDAAEALRSIMALPEPGEAP